MSSIPRIQKGGTKLSAKEAESTDFNTCKCAGRLLREGYGVQCTRKPFEGGLLCKTHQKILDARGSLPFGWFNKERPTHDSGGKPISWESNATDPHGNTARPDSSDKTSDGVTTRDDGSKHVVFSRDGVNFHGDMGAGGSIIITGVKKLTRFRNEPAEELLKIGIDVPDGCRVVTSWTQYDTKFKEALDRPENIKLKDKFKKYPNCSKKMYAFIHMSPGAPGEGALLDLIRESVNW